MNMEHVIKVDDQIKLIHSTKNKLIILGTGKDYSILYPASRKLVKKGNYSGRFLSRIVSI